MLSGVQTKGPTGSCWPSCWMINTLRWPRGRWIHCSQLCPWFSCDWRKSSGPSPVMTLLLSLLVGPLLSASLHLMPLYIAAQDWVTEFVCAWWSAKHSCGCGEALRFWSGMQATFLYPGWKNTAFNIVKEKRLTCPCGKKHLFEIEVKYFISCFSVKRRIIKYSA